MWRYIPAPGAEAEAQSPEAQEVQEAQETSEDHATTPCVKLTADEESQSRWRHRYRWRRWHRQA